MEATLSSPPVSHNCNLMDRSLGLTSKVRLKWSNPSVDCLDLAEDMVAVSMYVFVANRLNREVFPTPYSPHKITLNSGMDTEAMDQLSDAYGVDHWTHTHWR